MGRHQKPLKLLLILRLFFALYCYDAVSGSDLDKSALLEFKNSVSDPSGVLASWTGSNSDHCSWVGVTCGSNSRVVALNITVGGNSGSFTCTKYDRFLLYGFGIRKNCVGHNAKLTGKLSYAISKLSELRVLSLPFTDLSGEIPVEIWGMKKLEVIDLEGNMIHGHLQSNFTGLRGLRVLNLGFNRVSGEIPDSFSNFKNLQVLNLAGNHVNGSIPTFLNEFRDLKGLYLSFNQLSGEIPTEIGYSCGNLEHLELAGNFLLGRIPASLSNCTKLRSVLLYSNMLQEEIPVELGRLGMLQVLDVSRNSLSGAIPRQLGNCSELHFLDLSSNKLAGELSDELPVPCMTAFDVSNNRLSGPIPSFRYTTCEPFNPSSAYLQYFSFHTPLPFGNDGGYLAIMHNFGGNNFTGALSSLPVAPERTRANSIYAFLAGKNELTGRFPRVLFDRCSDLKAMVVNISSNRFSGEIPSNIGQICRSLMVLDVSRNSLSGEIPEDLVNLRNLTVLLLNNNKLSGPIPSGFANVTTITKFNVLFNNLSGPVPENLMATPSSEQQPPEPGRTGGGDYVNYSVSSTPAPKHGSRNFNSIEIAAITSASAIFSVLLALVVLFVYTRWRPKSVVHGLTRKEVTTFIDIGVPLTFENVVQSTGSFNASNCIGNGGFGATYKAEIAPGFLVAVKRLAVGRFQGVQQFDAEIKTLGRLRHPNLVTLIGYHASETEMFLVYNYLPGGNLEQFIQERPTRAVDWRVLHKIALDVARALAYLHDQCVPRVLHRDVKPSNILLDDDFNAYLSDFGLARLLGTSETHATTGVAGTFGYVAPEYAMTCRVSDKADVYSYGVVLLELMSDKKALDPSFSSYGNGFNIVAWACMLLREGQAKEFFATGLWDAGPHEAMVEVLHLAVVCTMDSLSTRPTMKQVVRRLKQLQPPPC